MDYQQINVTEFFLAWILSFLPAIEATLAQIQEKFSFVTRFHLPPIAVKPWDSQDVSADNSGQATGYTILERDYHISTTATPKNQVCRSAIEAQLASGIEAQKLMMSYRCITHRASILEIHFRNSLGISSKRI